MKQYTWSPMIALVVTSLIYDNIIKCKIENNYLSNTSFYTSIGKVKL